MSTPANAIYGSDTTATFAAKVRAKFPNAVASDGRPYSQIPDDELTRSVIRNHPTYQTWLSNDELQRLTRDDFSTGDAVKGNIDELMGGFFGTQHGSVGEEWQKLKNAGRYVTSHSPDRWVDDLIDNVSDAADAQAQHITNLQGHPLRQAVSSVPLIGPTIDNFIQNPNFRDAGRLLAVGTSAAAPETLEGAANAAGGVIPAARRMLTPSDTQMYQRIINPQSAKAAEQLSDVETWNRARPYLSQESQLNPVLAKQTEGPFAGQRLGVMNLRQNAQAASDKLWNNEITPRTIAFANAPIDHSAVASDIRGTLNPAAPADLLKSGAVHNLADFYDQPTTVADALNKIQALNQDRLVQAYEKALPDQQAAMLGANPELQAKLTAADSLREQVFNSIEKYGSPEESQYVREARKDFGALKEVGQNLGNASVPTPQSIVQRLANSVHGVVSPRGPHAYLSGGDSLFRVGDPNALAESLSQSLADANLQPRQGPAIRTTPWQPTPFNPPPAGPQAPPPVNPRYAVEGVGTPTNGGPTPLSIGRQRTATRVLPTEFPGEGSYKGLLTGPPPTFVPPVMPAVSQVGGPAPLVFPPTLPDWMWTPRATPVAPTWDLVDPRQVLNSPSSRLTLNKGLWPPRSGSN